ncbi:MAG: tRNA (adenosine(37)-N6)-dimethylallyltransferase MiaA [Anaerolineales bacterium]|nr:tRNA (adenosine(37)-N6)-dimethylallyltransferase MiaA [Anaerolineales bacterium]
MGIERENRVVALLGPTAVGKTDCSLKLAQQFPFEIISSDSRLFYHGMDIGTAKPSLQERERVPHFLIDVSPPTDPWSLQRYLQAARVVIDEICSRGAMPLLVGGTGQYVTALLEGWQPPPRPEDDSIRISLEAFAEREGAQALHQRLQEVDPQRASELDPRNVRRVIRALEIYESTGNSPSSYRKKTPPPYEILRIGLTMPREALYKRIDQRIDQMIENGWINEVQALLDQSVPVESSTFSAIGYAQLASYLRGEIPFDEALIQIRRITRSFVRRQANWFKPDDPAIHWLPAGPQASEQAAALIKRWIAGEPLQDQEQDKQPGLDD